MRKLFWPLALGLVLGFSAPSRGPAASAPSSARQTVPASSTYSPELKPAITHQHLRVPPPEPSDGSYDRRRVP